MNKIDRLMNRITELEADIKGKDGLIDKVDKFEHDLKELQSAEGMNGHIYHLEGRINNLVAGNNISEQNTQSGLDNHAGRIKALEEWKNDNIGFRIDNVDCELEKRIKALEEWKRMGLNNVDSHFESRIKALEKRQLLLIRDVESLERWKRFREEDKERLKGVIVIKQEIWQNLKREVAMAHGYCGCTSRGHYSLKEIERLIKKIEPDWDPDPIPDDFCSGGH